MTMDDSIILRRLQPDDAEALCAFYNGLSPTSKRTFRPIDETTTTAVCAAIAAENGPPTPTKLDLVAILGGGEDAEGAAGDTIVGWSFLWALDATDPEQGPVFGLAVSDAYHGRGLGTRLMSQVMAWARAQGLPQVVLTVVTDNAVAQHLYEKQGFVRYGTFTGEDGLPYYRMRAHLEGATAPSR